MLNGTNLIHLKLYLESCVCIRCIYFIAFQRLPYHMYIQLYTCINHVSSSSWARAPRTSTAWPLASLVSLASAHLVQAQALRMALLLSQSGWWHHHFSTHLIPPHSSSPYLTFVVQLVSVLSIYLYKLSMPSSSVRICQQQQAQGCARNQQRRTKITWQSSHKK